MESGLDGWMDGWMGGWVDEWMDGWMDGTFVGLGIKGLLDRQINNKFVYVCACLPACLGIA